MFEVSSIIFYPLLILSHLFNPVLSKAIRDSRQQICEANKNNSKHARKVQNALDSHDLLLSRSYQAFVIPSLP